jgi:hypothetical protein
LLQYQVGSAIIAAIGQCLWFYVEPLLSPVPNGADAHQSLLPAWVHDLTADICMVCAVFQITERGFWKARLPVGITPQGRWS